MSLQETYWTGRYEEGRTGWDIGYASTPLVTYFVQLSKRDLKILIPGAGNSYEAEYLFSKGLKNVHILDISKKPLENLKKRSPKFPKQHLHHKDFFHHQGKYDLIIEQTFFCALEPTAVNRSHYANKMADLLKSGGKLVGLWFDFPKGKARPFGGSKAEYLGYLSPYFDLITFEKCYNSIKPRAGRELFGIFKKSKV